MGTATSKDAREKGAVAFDDAPEGANAARLRIQGSSSLGTARHVLQLGEGDYTKLFAALRAASSGPGKDGANIITRAAFDSVLNKTLTGAPSSDAARYVRDEVVTTLFNSISSTGGQSIEVVHAQALTALCVHENEISTAAALLFSLVDTNSDGSLEKGEMLALAALQLRIDCAVRTATHIAAVDATEQLEATRKMFRAIDANDDGVIDVAEFQEWFAALLRASLSSEEPPTFSDMHAMLHRGDAWEYDAVVKALAAAADVDRGTITRQAFIDHVGSVVDVGGAVEIGEGEWPPRRVLRHLYDFIRSLECVGDTGSVVAATEEQCVTVMALFADARKVSTPTIAYRRDVQAPTEHDTTLFHDLFNILDVPGRGSIALRELCVTMDMLVRVARGCDVRTSAAYIASERRALHACARQDDDAAIGADEFSKWCATLLVRLVPSDGDTGIEDGPAPGVQRGVQSGIRRRAGGLTFAEMHALLGLRVGDFAAIVESIARHTAAAEKRRGPLPPAARGMKHAATITRAAFVESAGVVLSGPPVRGEARPSFSHAAALRSIFAHAVHAAAAREHLEAHAPTDGDDQRHQSVKAPDLEVDVEDLVAEYDTSVALGAMAIYAPLQDLNAVADWLFEDLDVTNSVRQLRKFY